MCRSDVLLEWNTRLQIAIGAAQGLAYLHKDYVPHLLHRNIKCKNILLDMDYEPKLTDFGLDHVVGESVFESAMASEPGSCVYMAPGIVFPLNPLFLLISACLNHYSCCITFHTYLVCL